MWVFQQGSSSASAFEAKRYSRDLMNFELGKDDLEASELYPDYNYTSIDQLLDIFLVHPLPPTSAAFE
ncbi:hypothetical protein VIGAN_07171500 [Vigna angularis var. angularis]|uniref:Uncharacterized protein n=1 Tax=Vigna angularis var. angularis TaxID=157739 RepID=A0A0S3SJ95_PHAAN|nr:hypothetical protein VIGAN_07171500 [Vigna angularis var. angularis]